MVRAFVAATRLAVVGPYVHEHVPDASSIGVLQHDGAVTAQRKHAIGIVERRQPARELETGIDEDANSFLEVRLGRTANNDQGHRVSLRRRANRSGTPSAMMSSTG